MRPVAHGGSLAIGSDDWNAARCHPLCSTPESPDLLVRLRDMSAWEVLMSRSHRADRGISGDKHGPHPLGRIYRPGIAPNSSVEPNPRSAPASAWPVARASAATAAATAGATSRLNTDGMM